MPFVHIRIAGPTLAPEQIARIKTMMTDLVVSELGSERALTSVLVEGAPVRGWSVGDEAVPALAHVVAQVTAGSTSPGQRARFIASSYALVERVLGRDLTPVSYVIVDEVPPDAWGYGGLAQSERRPRSSLAACL